MSNNQKQVPSAPPQQSRCYPQQPPFIQRSPTPQNRADGSFHVSTSPANFVQQSGLPQQQQQQISMRGAMPPTGPPNQASTPPQTDAMKVSQMQTPQGISPMYLQGTTSVRSNQSAYYRPPTMPAPTRSSTHHRQQPSHIFQPHVPVVYTQQIPPPTVPGIGIQNSQFHATYQPRTSQNFFPLPYPTIPSQPIFGFGSNQQATQQYYYGPNGPPINIIRGPQGPAPTGPQGPNQPSVAAIPMNQAHQMQTQQPKVPKRREHAIAIIDPITGKDKLKEIFNDDSQPIESGQSSARQTPQPDSHAEVPPEVLKNQRILDDCNTDADQRYRGDILPTEGFAGHTEELTSIDGPVNTKLGKKIEMIPPSESKLQAGTKEFIPVESSKPVVVAPREPPVVSAKEGPEVIVHNKPLKERESPAKSRKARETAAQRNVIIETPLTTSSSSNVILQHQQQQQQQQIPPQHQHQQQQREPTLVQSLPLLNRDSGEQHQHQQQQQQQPQSLHHDMIPSNTIPITMSQPHIIDTKQHHIIPQHQQQQTHEQQHHVIQQVASSPREGNMPKEQHIHIPPQSQHSIHQKDSSTVVKDISMHHSDTTLTSKGKQQQQQQPSKVKPGQVDTKFIDTKTQIQNSTITIPHGDNLQGKNKANTDSKKSINNKDTTKQPSVPPSTTSSAPALQKQQQSQVPQPTQLPTTQPVQSLPNTTPPASTVPLPIPVSQPPKPTNKTNKMRELNRKGADKEGTDMDAFNTNENPTPNNETNETTTQSTNIVTPPSTPVTESTIPSSVIIDSNKAAQQQNLGINNSNNDISSSNISKTSEVKMLPKPKVDVCSIVRDVEKQIPTKSITTNKENESDNKNLNLSETEKLVQAKNEANAKSSIVPAVNNYLNTNNNSSSVIDVNKTSAPTSLTLPYTEEQWAPWNTSGKKKYLREFLVALQNDPKSIRKPDLPRDLESLINHPKHNRLPDHNSSNRYSSMNRHDVLLPPYAKTQSQRGPLPKRNSQQGKASKTGGKPNVIHVSLSLKEDVKLNETENAWKPARLVKGSAQNEEDAKTAELYKKVRGVLNKLTPQKFDTLVNQVRQLNIDNCERLQGVIDLVFEKAIDEPNYSVAYALMCRELALMQVPAERKNSNDPGFVNFRKLLITRCQMEFEKTYVDEKARKLKVKEIEDETDPEKKKELQLQLEEDDRRVRLKSVGNVRFIGELFKQQMLTASIMMKCLKNLLNGIEEENLECLCKLLITVGKDLEIEKKMSLESFFQTMQEIVDRKHGKISSRVRFMLQDVIELRNNKWIPRRQDLKPTTIDEIQKEAESEHLNIQILNSAPLNTPRKDDRGSSAQQGSDRKRGGRNNVGEDGWSTAQSRSRQTFSVESSKLKSTKPITIDAETLGSRSGYAKWSKGSTANVNPPTTITNMYSPLEHIDAERIRQPQGGSRNGSKDPYSSKGPSMERSNYKSYDDGRGSRSGSQARSRDGSQARQQPTSLPTSSVVQPQFVAQQLSSHLQQTPTQQQQPQTPPVKELTEDEIEQHTQTIVNDYWNDLSVSDVCEAEIKTLFGTDALAGKFVGCSYLYSIEKSSTARKNTGNLVAVLCQRGLITQKAVCTGLQSLLEVVEDLIIDLPKIWDYLSELVVPLLAEGVLSLKVLREVAFSCAGFIQQEDYPGKLLVHLCNSLSKDKGPSFPRKLWLDSGLQFSDFVPNHKVSSFIKDNKLEYLSGSASIPENSISLSFDEIRAKLLEFFEKDVTFNHITEWVTANVGKEKATEKEFIRALMTAVCEHSIQKMKLNEDVLKKHFFLLQRYVDNKADREMQCLHALKAYINKLEHPPGVLLAICNNLWDSAVLSNESFLQWEKCTDPAEQEGKGVALKTLTSFFTSVREAEDDSSTSEVEE
ncbi:eukaryotic translation initiation factor 4 gamma 1-like isoform X3 [Chrysoperla carnea]|uniref:eukaryotic translation initiation factor 4 gamma 1-like isoform X3 n=1 Tax=Chrysoperla carnea TaxID=189513 RepID=UPI001D06FEB7|nr:eukaryotic translation initiation factor 4 gamma 1-like isoform X3 [Chrysoperla carnea]